MQKVEFRIEDVVKEELMIISNGCRDEPPGASPN